MTVNNDTAFTKGHPCFDPAMHGTCARVHLPVAPDCNVQCRFCNRLFDCVNETRPGVTSAVLTPHQAVEYLRRLIDGGMPVSVAGIAGPGDAFCRPETTLETLTLVKKTFPELLLCVSTNGLAAAPYAAKLAAIGVSHVSITVNAVDAAVAQNVYAWVRVDKKVLRGRDMAEAVIARQELAIAAFVKSGLTVKVNAVVIPEVNEAHIEQVACKAAKLGAKLFNCMPLIPVAGTPFEHTAKPDHELMQTLRWNSSRILPVMRHCGLCRADAAGIIGKENSAPIDGLLREIASGPRIPGERRPYVAVTSREGLFINEHLGAASAALVFDPASGEKPIGARALPACGGGERRWSELADALADCRALLTYRLGESPRRALEEKGLTVIETEGFISEALAVIARGALPASRPNRIPCGQGCTGTGGGCG